MQRSLFLIPTGFIVEAPQEMERALNLLYIIQAAYQRGVIWIALRKAVVDLGMQTLLTTHRGLVGSFTVFQVASESIACLLGIGTGRF